MSRKINETLSELITGILIMGLVIQGLDFLAAALYPQFRSAIPKFALGFWIGIAVAVGFSVHMYCSIDKALDMYKEDAEKYIQKIYLLRTVGILLTAGIVRYFRLGYVMAFFLGIICIKLGAGLQPVIHKVKEKFRRNKMDKK